MWACVGGCVVVRLHTSDGYCVVDCYDMWGGKRSVASLSPLGRWLRWCRLALPQAILLTENWRFVTDDYKLILLWTPFPPNTASLCVSSYWCSWQFVTFSACVEERTKCNTFFLHALSAECFPKRALVRHITARGNIFVFLRFSRAILGTVLIHHSPLWPNWFFFFLSISNDDSGILFAIGFYYLFLPFLFLIIRPWQNSFLLYILYTSRWI